MVKMFYPTSDTEYTSLEIESLLSTVVRNMTV